MLGQVLWVKELACYQGEGPELNACAPYCGRGESVLERNPFSDQHWCELSMAEAGNRPWNILSVPWHWAARLCLGSSLLQASAVWGLVLPCSKKIQIFRSVEDEPRLTQQDTLASRNLIDHSVEMFGKHEEDAGRMGYCYRNIRKLIKYKSYTPCWVVLSDPKETQMATVVSMRTPKCLLGLCAASVPVTPLRLSNPVLYPKALQPKGFSVLPLQFPIPILPKSEAKRS